MLKTQRLLKQTKELSPEFFTKTALEMAPKLLGLFLIHKTEEGTTAGIITETEAYCGPEDRACHAYNMLKTKRNEAIYGPPGTAYVYLIYGLYHCFNIAVFEEGTPHGVLIRSIKPVVGLDIMRKRRKGKLPLSQGPGRLCQAMGINISHNKADVTTGDLYVARHPRVQSSIKQLEILKTPRIGIDYAGEATHYPWRFVLSSKR